MSTSPPAGGTTRRLLFIDMFRGLAVLVMIEGHVFNSTILPALRPTKQFHYLDLLHGMIAPSFIFISGFAFALGLERKWDSFLRFEKPFWMQVRRLLFVLAVAYWLHLPAWSFQTLLHSTRETIYYFLRCDVLQLIALSLLFSLLLCVILRNQKLVVFSLLILALIIVFVTPFVYYVDPRLYFPFPLSDYINALHGALFPLFPWAAYSFAGTCLCWIYLRVQNTDKEKRLFAVLAITGIILFIGAFILFYAPWQYYKYVDPARSSPRHFMMKIGFILFTLACIWYYEQKQKPEKSILNKVGQESLLVYGLHLVLVYGASFMPHHLSKDVGKVFTFAPAFAVSFGLMGLMIAAALPWNWLKSKHPAVAKRIFYLACAVYFIKFFVI
ncbi:DUF1624 domain-containing protein [bacterium]|nr:DUF1624 domain-containing protein [bacterium]MCI0604336.1 DUF1624 domain-containing protein [bacterium]